MNINHEFAFSKRLFFNAKLELLLNSELTSIGLTQYLFVILDPNQVPIYQLVNGFTSKQLETYQNNIHHDAYLNRYIGTHSHGQILHLQKMLPLKQIRDPIFHDVLLANLGSKHSFSGIAPIVHQYSLVLSSHSNDRVSYKNQQHLQKIWAFIISWSNAWISQRLLDEMLPTLKTQSLNPLLLTVLTEAELGVFELLLQGLNGSEIAQLRDVSKETVRYQIKQILHKTQCRHQNDLLSRYYRNLAL